MYAEDEPDYLLGNLTFGSNLTREQSKEVADKVINYTSTMKKEANGNETKLAVLLIEDLAKRNIINEEAKRGFISYIASLPKPPVGGIPGTFPGNITEFPRVNNTAFHKNLETSAKLLDDIAKNNTDSQPVTLMTDILKKRGNVTNIGPVLISDDFPTEDYAKAVVCAAYTTLGGLNLANGLACYYLIK